MNKSQRVDNLKRNAELFGNEEAQELMEGLGYDNKLTKGELLREEIYGTSEETSSTEKNSN